MLSGYKIFHMSSVKELQYCNISLFFHEEISEIVAMENLSTVSGSAVRHNPRAIEEEVIPESFPTWKAFFKTVGWGVSITLAEYGFLILLIARHR